MSGDGKKMGEYINGACPDCDCRASCGELEAARTALGEALKRIKELESAAAIDSAGFVQAIDAVAAMETVKIKIAELAQQVGLKVG